ncbi:MAG: J domain-containing protein [bacterium]|nr:J domain-containing protein [bacterium]
MTIETALKNLVELYTQFDVKKNAYIVSSEKIDLLQLDNNFMKLLNQQLLLDGPEKHQIEKKYRKLSLYFHTDRKPIFLPAVSWLEQQLSEGKNNGICFTTLTSCYERLAEPIKFKEIGFNDIKSKADCKKWLETLKKKSQTYSGRSLCSSLIDLLDQSSGFFNEAGKIRPQGLNALIQFIPMTFASYATILMSEELLAIYALYFIVLKGGQYLGRSNYIDLKKMGKTLEEVSTITALTTSMLLVRLLQMTFWTSQHCLDMSLRIGSAVLKPILSAPESPLPDDAELTAKICQDLILAGKQLSPGMIFNTPQLKVISAPFEKYLRLNEQQFLGNWRLGKEKRLQTEALLFQMRVIDQCSGTLESKLDDVKNKLEQLQENKTVYTHKMAHAVDEAKKIIELLDDTSAMKLVLYDAVDTEATNMAL